jgi:hypothetical protein
MSSCFSRTMKSVLAASCLFLAVHPAGAQQLGDVFYIDMENHNFTQPTSQTSPAQLLGNPAASFQNSLINGSNSISQYVSYATNYQNAAVGDHPSEPNYIWQEAGTNFGISTDSDPSNALGNNLTTPHLTGLLQNAGISWKVYAEDMQDVSSNNGIAPIHSGSGITATTNPYNGSNQYNYAVKHVGPLFFTDTNGASSASHYAPLEQLTADLNSNNIARYTEITPDQYNDSHSALNGGFTYNGVHYTGDAAEIAQGDNFLSIIIPQIMASQAWQNNGAIVIWWDETEGGDSSAYTLEEMVISKLGMGNDFADSTYYTHSSDLRTLEEVYGVYDGFLNGANNANDLSGLFKPNVIPSVPEPSQLLSLGLGVVGLGSTFVKARKRRQSA